MVTRLLIMVTRFLIMVTRHLDSQLDIWIRKLAFRKSRVASLANSAFCELCFLTPTNLIIFSLRILKLIMTIEEPLLLTTWERAKRKLFVEITEGRLSDDVPPGKVWDDDEEGGVYKACKRDNFSNNLWELRKRINKWKDEAEIDRLAEINDRKLFPIDVSGRWPGSKAEKLLKKDIDEEKYPLMSARELYSSPDRKEYQEFDYQCFQAYSSCFMVPRMPFGRVWSVRRR